MTQTLPRLALLLGASLWARSASAQEQLDMVPGQQRVISAPGVTRIAVANPNVADVKVTGPGEVLITAVGDGSTELTIWRGAKVVKYDVIVTTLDPKQLKKEVDKLIGDREGLRTRVVRDQVYIEGNVLTLPDLEKAEEIAQIYPSQVRNMVKLDPSAHTQIAKAINKELTHAGLTKAQAMVVGNTIFLEGMVDSEADMKKAEIITRAMGQNIESTLRIGASRLIELDVEFVEVSKNSLDRIGVRWPTDISGTVSFQYNNATVLTGIQPDSSAFSINASASASLGLSLQFNDGVSRVLAHPRLVTANNKEASFLAGGEVPIPIVTEQRVYVEFKEYGIRLKITPIADANGTIQTKVLTEVSQPDSTVAVMGIPGFLTRRVDTEVTVRDGETIVLSGLLHISESKDVTKIPILGHIPIIGELFKSRAFRENQTELVVFVTPRLVDPVSKHLREEIRDIRKRFDEAEGDVAFSLFD
jgi:pilus assembly protein CpaC